MYNILKIFYLFFLLLFNNYFVSRMLRKILQDIKVEDMDMKD